MAAPGRTWLRVRVCCPPEAADAVVTALLPLSPNGVETEEGPPTCIIGFLGPYGPPADPAEAEAKVRAVLASVPDELLPRPIELTISPLPEDDWIAVFRAQHHPVRIGRVVIKPTWEPWPSESLPARADDVLIVLDPGLAFGTGLHATTRGCLLELQARIRRGDRAVDFGCGTGILAIAAAKLGARAVLAIDFDPVAVEVARENAARNEVADRVQVQQGATLAGLPDGQDLILANVSPPVVVAEAPNALAILRPGGAYVCAGIPISREGEVLEALREVGFGGIVPRELGEWVAFVCVAPAEGARPT